MTSTTTRIAFGNKVFAMGVTPTTTVGDVKEFIANNVLFYEYPVEIQPQTVDELVVEDEKGHYYQSSMIVSSIVNSGKPLIVRWYAMEKAIFQYSGQRFTDYAYIANKANVSNANTNNFNGIGFVRIVDSPSGSSGAQFPFVKTANVPLFSVISSRNPSRNPSRTNNNSNNQRFKARPEKVAWGATESATFFPFIRDIFGNETTMNKPKFCQLFDGAVKDAHFAGEFDGPIPSWKNIEPEACSQGLVTCFEQTINLVKNLERTRVDADEDGADAAVQSA